MLCDIMSPHALKSPVHEFSDLEGFQTKQQGEQETV